MGTCLKSTQEPEGPPGVQSYWVKLIAFVCQHIYIRGCALMERLWVEGYWSPSRLPSGGLGGSCVAPHNLITSYHRSQHIDSNLDNNLNNILDNNVYLCISTFTRRLSRARFTRSLTASTFSVIMFFSVVSTSCAQFQSVLFAISRSISSRLLKSHVEKKVNFSLPLQFRFLKKGSIGAWSCLGIEKFKDKLESF